MRPGAFIDFQIKGMRIIVYRGGLYMGIESDRVNESVSEKGSTRGQKIKAGRGTSWSTIGQSLSLRCPSLLPNNAAFHQIRY